VSAADVLTLFRAAAGVPIFVAIGYGERTIALAIFVVAALTDALDGILARRNGSAEGHGVLFDPLADKVLVVLTLIALALAGSAPAGIVAIVVVREILVGVWRVQTYRYGSQMHALVSAKVKTACEMAALTLLIAPPTPLAGDVGAALLTTAALIGIVTLPTHVPHTRRRFT
jgi:CDP-diacylglycerol--glycerol-3-phosphate 3-phosphatidyltransferase